MPIPLFPYLRTVTGGREPFAEFSFGNGSSHGGWPLGAAGWCVVSRSTFPESLVHASDPSSHVLQLSIGQLG